MSDPIGVCRLCRNTGELVEGHIWPRFCYKRYVLDLKKGGRFGDLMKLDWNIQQYREYWFCRKCDNEVLSGWETQGARLCAQLKKGARDSYTYTAGFLPFVVSISWRVAMLHLQRENSALNVDGKAAVERWRQCLCPPPSGATSCSQHAFVAFDQDESLELHNGIGGEIHAAEGFVLSHLGPLFLVGWLEKERLIDKERAIWARSEISLSGGKITAIESQETCNLMVAPSLFKLLEARQQRTIEALAELGRRNQLL